VLHRECTRTLYYIWEHMLHHEKDQLRVSLLLNRARVGGLYSYIPYQGRVDLKMKEACGMYWYELRNGSRRAVRNGVQVNGTRRSLHWQGRYLDLGAMKPGDARGDIRLRSAR